MSALLDPQRTLQELKELRALTSDAHGAQRVAFTPMWTRARQWLQAKLHQLPVEVHTDAAGNLWATLRGQSERAVLIGGHLDSVPNGGWLDGALNTLAGLECLREAVQRYGGVPPTTIRLVDWADEEGARFGRSLFGSSACSGTLILDEVRQLRDAAGQLLPTVLAEHGIAFERVKDARRELAHAAAYLELHIEQGPVLLDRNLPLGAVLGTFGVKRHALTFGGEAAHAGSTPMNRRRDAFLAAARLAPEIYMIAERFGGVCTIGSCSTLPGIPTSVVERCRITLDQRHLEAARLAEMLDAARSASERFARDAGVTLVWETLVDIAPQPFHRELIKFADDAIAQVCGAGHRLPSGPLHDAAEMARAGIPTAMLFVQSLRGISHNRSEDTREDHLALSVRALSALLDRTIKWVEESNRGADGNFPARHR